MNQSRRGSHATCFGQEFSWVLIWTIIGALIPGTGLIAAGRRRAGGIVLGFLGVAGLLAVLVALKGNWMDRGMALAVNPQQLLFLALAVGLFGLLWVAVILLTSLQLGRSAELTSGQRAFSTVLVLALSTGVALPAFKVSDYALIQRGVLNSDSVFQGDSARANTRPDVAKADPWAAKKRMNVLLLGSDAGKNRSELRTDTMILASIDTHTGATVLFSLPRNLQKARFAPGSPGARAMPNGLECGKEKDGMPKCLLAHTWRWATLWEGREFYHGEHAGLRATEDAVEGVTGLAVDTYVMLNLNGFRDFVDAIGPITVDVHQRLPIGGNSKHPVATGGYIEAGKSQKLDGYRALWFARSRWSTDDYDRMKRQRCVIGAVVKKADPKTLALNFPSIAKALKSNLTTGIATKDLPAWVELSQRVKGSTVTSLPFTDDVISRANPDFPRVHAMVRKAIAASLKPAAKQSADPAATPSTAPSPKNKGKDAKSGLNPAKAHDLSAVC
jgi:LCP family protein required for cell wall assembly